MITKIKVFNLFGSIGLAFDGLLFSQDFNRLSGQHFVCWMIAILGLILFIETVSDI